MPEEFLSGRKRNIKVGLSGFNDTETVLEVSGKVGIGTTLATTNLHVEGDQFVTGVITSTSFSGDITSNVGVITDLHAENGYIQTGIVTTIDGSLLTYTTGNFVTGQLQVGLITALSGGDIDYDSGAIDDLAGDHFSFLGVSTAQTLQGGVLSYSVIYTSNITGGIGIVTTLSGVDLKYTGISTLTNAEITDLTVTDAYVTGQLLDRNADAGNPNEVLISTGSQIDWVPISTINNFNGLTVKDEGITVGIAASITSLNFIGAGVTAADDGTGVGVSITIQTDPGGIDGQVQYNDNGTFNGSQIYFNDSTNKVGINTSVLTRTLEVVGDVGITSNLYANRVFVAETVPLQITELTSKSYVDAFAQGIQVQKAVSIASTENIGGAYDNGSAGEGAKIYGVGVGTTSIDETALILGDRVLIKDQTNQAHNGFYEVTRVGNGSTGFELTRAPDYDETGEIQTGDFAFVIGGVREAAKGFALITKDDYAISVGTTALEFTQISSPSQKQAGLGLYDSGNFFNVGTASSDRITVEEDAIDLAAVTTTFSIPGTRTDTFASVIDVDGFGRVVGVTSLSHVLADSSIKGIASFNDTNLSVTSGVVTLSQSQRIYDLSVSGITTVYNRLNVGTGGTVFTAYSNSGITSVGINSSIPGFTLDVNGTINSSTDVTVNGESILFTANNDAVALAIALG